MDIHLDINKAAVDEHGVRDFLWPLARHEVVAVRDTLMPRLVSVVRDKVREGDEDATLVSIVIMGIISDALGLYQVTAIHRRAAAQGGHLLPPASSRLYHAILSEAIPGSPPLPQALLKTPHRATGWRSAILRPIWRCAKCIQWNGVTGGAFRNVDYQKDIIATSNATIIRDHARVVDELVRYSSFSDWFRTLEADPAADGTRLPGSLMDGVLDAIEVSFRAGNEELPSFARDYFRDWIDRATALVRRHLRALAERTDGLPRQLWTGTGGQLWGRILRHAVQRAGGTVTGHDHSIGLAHLQYHGRMLNDFESCDRFMTYSDTHAQSLQRNVNPDLQIPTIMPEIVALPADPHVASHEKEHADRNSKPARPSSVRTVMYPMSFYNGERMHLGVTIPDIVQVDWEARLFAEMRRWGYRVIHKPHPGSVTKAPPAFVDELGVIEVLKPFESVMHDADVLIFTHPQSTTFAAALVADRPIVLIDFGMFVWWKEAKDLIERRCAVVQGWFDEQNRAHVNWDELQAATVRCLELDDPGFATHYLSRFEV